MDFALARGNPDSRLVGVVSPARVHLSRPLLQKIVANVVGIGERTQLAPSIDDGDTEDVGLDSKAGVLDDDARSTAAGCRSMPRRSAQRNRSGARP